MLLKRLFILVKDSKNLNIRVDGFKVLLLVVKLLLIIDNFGERSSGFF